MTVSPLQAKWDRVYQQRNVGADPHPGILDDVAHLLPTRGARSTWRAAPAPRPSSWPATAWRWSPGTSRAWPSTSCATLRRGTRCPSAPKWSTSPRRRIPQDAFDVVFVSRYLERGLCAALSRALRPGGLLIYQTFSIEALDSAPHKNPDYCLVRGELLNLFHDLQPLLYREDALVGDTSRGLRNEARLVAQRPSPAPRLYADWVWRATDNDDPAALSRAIERHRRRLASLDDPLGPLLEGAPAGRENARDLIEDAEVVVMHDGHARTLRALVVAKGNLVLPTDMPQAALTRLDRVVDTVAEAFRRIGYARHCQQLDSASRRLQHEATARRRGFGSSVRRRR